MDLPRSRRVQKSGSASTAAAVQPATQFRPQAHGEENNTDEEDEIIRQNMLQMKVGATSKTKIFRDQVEQTAPFERDHPIVKRIDEQSTKHKMNTAARRITSLDQLILLKGSHSWAT